MTKRTQLITGIVVSAVVFAVSALALFAMEAAPKPATAKTKEKMERLDAPREIQGVPCMTRYSHDDEGKLRSCVLARDMTFGNGLTLAEGSQVGFDADLLPNRVFLPANTEFDGHMCIGTGTHDAMTNFHPNGRLRFCNLARVETIGGVPCQQSSFWIWVTQGGSGTYFHDNGALQSCLLAGDVTVAGRAYKQKDHIKLDRDGTPID